MATGKVKRNGVGVARGCSGINTGDGTALSVTIGFMPHRVRVMQMTDGAQFEYVDGMDPNTTLKNASTVDTTGAIVVMEKGFIVSAAVNANGKKLVWFAD